VRRAPWLLVAIHVPFVVAPVVFTITGLSLYQGPAVPAILCAIAVGGLQLRHSFAAARGERPAGWVLTFLLLLAAVYGPMIFFAWNWATTQNLVIMSAAMLLRGWLRVVVITVPIVVTCIAGALTVAWYDHGTVAQLLVITFYWLLNLTLGGAALYGAARTARVVEELYTARTELAEVAIGRERVRVSRDLHDLLGQSLSAVSLKGDLAIKLLPHDTEGARAELESLTELARTALRDVRAVARDEHAVSLRGEIEAAGALLSAAGIEAHIDVDLPELPALARPAQDVLAWAVREGTTNLLRHSEANTASITVARRGGVVRMEIVNDGVREPAGTGTGIAGVVERARAVSGSASASADDGRFRLTVAVPEVAA
jgi:two-component system, NarL family, sensor histidine kinase DesK